MKKRTFYLVLAIVVLIIIAVIAYRAINQKETYTFKVDKFSYTHRGKAKYTETFLNKTGNISVYSVTFPSRNFLTYPITIYGLLFIPTGKKGGVVLLPGGGVSKEAESRLANILAEKGYAVLTIDQRGIGETGGYYLGFDDDYRVFLKGDEPIQHLSVYDALRAYDVLKEIYGKDEIAMMGESMGGRYAMIAGAVEKRLKGVLVISSSGFHFDNSNPYLLSIDPDHYVSDIAPRPLVMLHGDNDSTVKIDDAKITYSLARQ